MKTCALLLAACHLLTSATSAQFPTQVQISGPPGSGEFGRTLTVLPNGNFLVTDPGFDLLNPPVTNVGAVYLFNPDGLLISTLRGSSTNDQVGGSSGFGVTVVVLTNGNFVVVNRAWNNGSATNAGAVTWGSATTGFPGAPVVTVSPANSLVGSSNGDGSLTNVTPLPNGNYVVNTRSWDNGSVVDAGAVTWGNGLTGTSGTISPANSLVGSSANDQVGGFNVVVLTNSNYVVISDLWDNGGIANRGAVTWGSGLTGISGPVSAANSLVGSTLNDQVGSTQVMPLANGNYVVVSPLWDNGPMVNPGAVTWGNGTTGTTGPVSLSNSLVGSSAGDEIGSHDFSRTLLAGVTPLTNGHYVVVSLFWKNEGLVEAGAVTWGNGFTGETTGLVSPANSLVGTTANDRIGHGRVIALTNGNYVVASPLWDDGAVVNAGAATWGNGATGISGPVSRANSLFGTNSDDTVGSTATALTNGHYVVESHRWNNNTIVNAGAVTWGNGTKGITGPVSPANSLVGTSPNDSVGRAGNPTDDTAVLALTNGNYLVGSELWDNGGIADRGAATWGDGTKGTKGPVTAANSLIGSTAGDNVGISLFALTNGNYLVRSGSWDNGAITNAGAVTWGNGFKGTTGIITPANSLVGTSNNDAIGSNGLLALSNGNYLVVSSLWDDVAFGLTNAGAVTWGNGTAGVSGPITLTNSLVGTTEEDQLGNVSNVTTHSNGDYVVISSSFDNPSAFAVNSGVASLGNGSTGTTGRPFFDNSVFGDASNTGFNFTAAYDPVHRQMIVGRRFINQVTLFRGDRLRTLAKPTLDAPGAADIAFAKPGTAAISPLGAVLADSTLIGSGATKGRSRALFATSTSGITSLVLQTGTPLSALGGLPSNTVATTLFGQVFNRSNYGLFQATVKGTGLNATNNRLLLLDNGASVQLLHRSGQPIGSGPFPTARIKSYNEVLQHHTANLITLRYTLAPGGAVNAANDSGLLLLDAAGGVVNNFSAREGETVFGDDGTFGPITGSTAAALASAIHFTATFKPATGKPQPALFSMSFDGTTKIRQSQAGDTAPQSGGAKFRTFTGLTQFGPDPLVRATLANSPKKESEGLFIPSLNFLFMRTGQEVDQANLPDVKIARILRFWPSPGNPNISTPDHIITLVQLTGPGVTPANNQALILSDLFLTSPHQILLRTGFPAPGVAPSTLKTFSAIDVNPISGAFAVLGTLSGAPSSSNQALWTGNPKFANNTTLRDLRLPKLTLRKGNLYTTAATPQSVIRSIALKPALDPTGAGGRGLAHALGANGDLALFITGDRKLTEMVILDR